MSNLLLKYIKRGIEEAQKDKQKQFVLKPVITISREFGCPSHDIAKLLVEKINEGVQNPEDKWKWVSKEILEQSALELNIDPSKIEYVFNNQQRSLADEIIAALSSKYYKSDKKIRTTIKEIIDAIAMQGNVVIVGRGGVAITREHPKSLHIRLDAPINWRITRTAQRHGLSDQAAKKKVVDTDKNRMALINDFLGYASDHTIFDVILNCKYLSEEEVVQTIISMAKHKKMI